jgi:hypothetical protein
VLPSALTRRGAATSAKRLAAAASEGPLVPDVVAALDAAGAAVDERVVRDVLSEVAARFHDVALVAAREADRRSELAALAPQVLDVPSLDSDVHDLGGLMSLVDHLRS